LDLSVSPRCSAFDPHGAAERRLHRGLLLTTESVVVEKPEKEKAGGPAGGMGGMGDMY
jgi:hypothetical protein